MRRFLAWPQKQLSTLLQYLPDFLGHLGEVPQLPDYAAAPRLVLKGFQGYVEAAAQGLQVCAMVMVPRIACRGR